MVNGFVMVLSNINWPYKYVDIPPINKHDQEKPHCKMDDQEPLLDMQLWRIETGSRCVIMRLRHNSWNGEGAERIQRDTQSSKSFAFRAAAPHISGLGWVCTFLDCPTCNEFASLRVALEPLFDGEESPRREIVRFVAMAPRLHCRRRLVQQQERKLPLITPYDKTAVS